MQLKRRCDAAPGFDPMIEIDQIAANARNRIAVLQGCDHAMNLAA